MVAAQGEVTAEPYTTGCAADVRRRVCTVSGYVRQRETVLAFGKEPFLMCAIVSDGMIWEVKLDQAMPKKAILCRLSAGIFVYQDGILEVSVGIVGVN